MKIKTRELTGAALDWAVAKCEGLECTEDMGLLRVEEYEDEFYVPSMKWAQGGAIIERERLSFCYNGFNGDATPPEKAYIGFIWNGRQHEDLAFGETPLIASMRCYVASELGDEVEIPKELTQ